LALISGLHQGAWDHDKVPPPLAGTVAPEQSAWMDVDSQKTRGDTTGIELPGEGLDERHT